MDLPSYIRGHERVAVIAHELADIDAATSAAALVLLAPRLGVEIRAFMSGNPSRAARKVFQISNVEYGSVESMREFGPSAVVLVDVGSLERVGEAARSYILEENPDVLVVDHHMPDMGGLRAEYMVDIEASSTSEILALAMEAGGLLTPEVACQLAMGMMADTRGLRVISCRSLHTFADLCSRCGKTPEELQQMTAEGVDRSEVVARLKALRRTRMLEAGGWIVAIAVTESHQSAVAQSLVHLGADVGMAIGGEGGHVMGSIRASRGFASKSGVNVGDLARRLGATLGGYGGGHVAAASFQARSKLGLAIDSALNVLSEMLNLKLKEIA